MKAITLRSAHGAWLAGWLLAMALAFGGSAQAIEEGTTAQGGRYVSGGVSEEERLQLFLQRDRFTLWVITAVAKSGAYLADVRVKVMDAQRQPVFEKELDGPWLMIELPPGLYVVEARFNGQTRQRSTFIHPGDHHQAFFHFETPDGDEVSPEPRPTTRGRVFSHNTAP